MVAPTVVVETVTFPNAGVNRPAFVARPPGGPWPAVIVIHEIFGLTPHFEDVCRRLAKEGYVAMAPDLFALGGRPVSGAELEAGIRFNQSLPPEVRRDPEAIKARLLNLAESERDAVTKGLDWLRRRDLDLFVPMLQDALAWLSAEPYVLKERIAAIGFCMGGALSVRLAAAAAPLAACVVFYGEGPPIERLPNIRAPVLGLYGGEDARIADGVPAFADAMREAGKRFESHVYPGAGHAFFNDTQETYRKEAAEDAWARVLAFLREHLRGS